MTQPGTSAESIGAHSTDNNPAGLAATLVARTRMILWISLLCGLVFTAFEVALAPQLAGPFVVKCIGLAVIVVGLVFVREPRAVQHALPLSIAVVCIAYLLTAISGMVSPSREYDTTAVLFVGGALTTATLLPWGLWPQALTVLWGAMLLGCAVLWSDGNLYGVFDDPDMAVVIGLSISIATAREMQRYRLASMRELAARRRAEIEVRTLNAGLERRVTERTEALRTANEQLHALSARLESVREEERTRIAREIHDDLGQMLTALKIDIDMLPQRLAGTDVASTLWRKLSAMSDLAGTVISSVQRIAAELRPSVLDDLGLREAIQWQAREFERRCGVSCTFECELHDAALDSERSTALFRIAQEALTNIARHAAAMHVTITLRDEGDHVILDIRDDGRGVSKARVHSPQSLGLLGMHERARLLGGDVEIYGAPRIGTTVRVRIPRREPFHSLTDPASAGESR